MHTSLKITNMFQMGWNMGYNLSLQVARIKCTTGRQKTCEIFHVYYIFYSGFMCQTTVIIGITKDGSLVLNPLAS